MFIYVPYPCLRLRDAPIKHGQLGMEMWLRRAQVIGLPKESTLLPVCHCS